ncbi:MAG TPA: HD domain-containing phosphohydrolase [Burkholderiales bacterium]|nr:HD domain-containing phosphohydrolase [Burkholderiales bacterium]
MGKRRIAANELTIGSVLAWDAYDANGRLLLRRGQIISSSTQLEGLIERGLFAQIDPPREKPVVRVDVNPSAVALLLEARRRLALVCGPQGPKTGFPEHVMKIRELVREACRVSQDAALGMLLLERNGRYSVRHSVDVAIACEVVGPELGINEPELTSTVCAALTMNFSILQLQDDLQAQQAPLSAGQREVIHRHPEESAQLLRGCGVSDEIWLCAVLSHHEAVDGSGYLHGRKGDDIPLAAQLLSLADVYCARISSRDYRPSLRPNAALRALFLEQGKKVRDGLASQFIKAIGVFPAGTPVRIENGEIAVVVQRGQNASKPVVCSIVGPQGMPLAVPIRRDTSQPNFTVKEVVSWAELGALPSMQTLWGKVAALA